MFQLSLSSAIFSYLSAREKDTSTDLLLELAHKVGVWEGGGGDEQHTHTPHTHTHSHTHTHTHTLTHTPGLPLSSTVCKDHP